MSQLTLLRWLYAGEIPEPQKIRVGHDKRAWTQKDVENVKRYKEANYRKNRVVEARRRRICKVCGEPMGGELPRVRICFECRQAREEEREDARSMRKQAT